MTAQAISTRELLVHIALGHDLGQEVIDWACELLVQGKSSKHLAYVAGYTLQVKNQNLEEFRTDLSLAIQELDLKLPDIKQAYSDYACMLCSDYLEGRLSQRSALNSLYAIWVDTNFDPNLRFDNRYDVWLYLEDSIQLSEEEYGPLLSVFKGINIANQEAYFRKEAEAFLKKYQADYI
ncbi:hypothetical protein [Cerasicoccus maritimus]|uniref:hypothetical protein n=1 Tax=Cerasicoccus maritimus TaxID=490089 RepID=UPI00285266D2|nr:hypothetical protein [Cerasicoccus maritimus]